MGVSTAVRIPQRSTPTVERSAPADGPATGPSASSDDCATAPRRSGETIEQCILRTLDQYFRDLDGARPCQLHQMVMQAVERPLLRFALDRSSGNQSAASELLGINRNTLRKKLIEHGMADGPAPKPATRPSTRSRKTPARRKR